MIAVPSSTTPVFAQSYCQCVCSYDHYGRRHCRQVCSQPRYAAPAPSYNSAPYYYSSPQTYSAPIDFDLVVLAAGVALILGVIVAIVTGITSGFSTNRYGADIKQIENNIAADNDITHDMKNAMHIADAHIAAMLAKYRKGDDHG